MDEDKRFQVIMELLERCKPLQQELREIIDGLMESNKKMIGGAK